MDGKVLVWFDIDNTLYSRASGIAELMGRRIHEYFVSMPEGLDEAKAHELHMSYYTQYGLALRGLVRHHEIDPLDFDARCDGSLPLDELLRPSSELDRLFADIDQDNAEIFAITNAYKTHATRVLNLLGLSSYFPSHKLVYCNYADPLFACKPEPEFFASALSSAGNPDPKRCYFVDDSLINVQAAKKLGWGSCVLFQELLGKEGERAVNAEEVGVDYVIHSLDGLRDVWPEVFRKSSKA